MTDVQVDVDALAKLARLEISEEEKTKLQGEIPSILEFVKTIQNAGANAENVPTRQNVMREDADPHPTGMYTERLLDAAPAREGNRIAVKQVISRKK